MNGLKAMVIFGLGVAVGVAVTYKYIENKYESIIQEEIDSVKQVFSQRRQRKNETEKEEPRKNKEKKTSEPPKNTRSEKTIYSDIIKKSGYVTTSDKIDVDEDDEPQVISPDEYYDEYYDERLDEYYIKYDEICLTLFADDAVSNDVYDLLDREEEIKCLGADWRKHIDDYDPDCVYIRNHRLKTDFKVDIDTRYYADIVSRPPHEGL